MSLFTFRFPHIPRLFSATLIFLALWAGFGLVLAVNGRSLVSGQPASFYLPILKRPLSSELHTQAAQALWSRGLTSEAKHEALLAQDLSGGTVLGESVAPDELLTQWESEPAKLTERFNYWKEITQQKPDYRDAFVMAASLAYRLGDDEEALVLINRAFTLDPSPTVEELKTVIEKSKK